MVIADFAVAEEDLVDQFLTINAVLERKPHIVVIERRRPRVHGERVVLRSAGRQNLDVFQTVEEGNRFQVDLVDHINRTRSQSALACSRVKDGQKFDAIEMTTAFPSSNWDCGSFLPAHLARSFPPCRRRPRPNWSGRLCRPSPA